MAYLCRCRQTRVNHLFSLLKRSYFQVSAPCLSDYISQKRLPSSSNPQQILGFLGRSNGIFDNVRFFASPVQSKKKEEAKKTKGPRLNEQIKSHMVRLVSDEGHEIVTFHVALERAKSLNSDLVEVDCNAKPIVCKIMDYHRDRYQQQLKEKERSKNKAESSVRKGSCKEVRLSLKIEQKDLEMKADMAKRLMERGYRVKCMVLSSSSAEEDEKAREAMNRKLRGLIDRVHALIEDVAFVESGPRLEKSQAYVIVRHIKFGPSKKGGKGASKFADTASSGRQKDDTTSKSTVGLTASQHSDSENDYDESLRGDSDSLSDATGADEKVFNFRDDMRNADRISDQNKKPVPEFVPPNVDLYPARIPRVPNYTGSSENRYASRQDSTRVAAGERLMPRPPNLTGPPSNLLENRYSRSPPGAQRYTQPGPGPDPKNFIPPCRREFPKQNPTTSDGTPPSKNYGIFSNSSTSLPK